MLGTLFVVATPIGNLEDVSARALRILREVTVIAAEDTRRTAHLLARYAIQTPTTSLHEHNEAGKAAGLIARLLAGESIALVSDAGTPTVSDPGEVLIGAAIAAGVRVEPIPGPSALLALLAVSGLSTETFTFLGFPPLKANARKKWLDDLGREGRTTIFFESPHRIHATLDQIRVVYGECHIVLGRELTKKHEQVIRGTISEVSAELGEPRGEICVALKIDSASGAAALSPPTDAQVVDEFWLITKTSQLTRRKAIGLVSRKLGISPNQVYDAIERSKNSGE